MRPGRLSAIVSVAWTTVSIAQSLPRAGPALPGPADTEAGEATFETAGRHSNATSAVIFTRTSNTDSQEWTWRVNISDVAVPNDLADLGKASANNSLGLHIANVQGQLSWPKSSDNDSETLEHFLQQQNTSLYVNFQSKYTRRTGSQSLKQTLVAKGQMFSMEDVEGCQSTIGNAGGLGSDLLISPNSNSSEALTSESSLYFLASKTFTGNDQTVYREAASALQLLLVDFMSASDIQHSGDNQGFVLCQILDQNAATSEGNKTSGASKTFGEISTYSPAVLTILSCLILGLFAWEL